MANLDTVQQMLVRVLLEQAFSKELQEQQQLAVKAKV